MASKKLQPFRFGWAALESALNQIVDAINRNQVLKGDGIYLQESAQGTVVNVSAQPATGGDSTPAPTPWATTPAGETAGWYSIKVLSADRTTVYDLWVWAGQPRNGVPCS